MVSLLKTMAGFRRVQLTRLSSTLRSWPALASVGLGTVPGEAAQGAHLASFTHVALAVFRQVALRVLQERALAFDILCHDLWKNGHFWFPQSLWRTRQGVLLVDASKCPGGSRRCAGGAATCSLHVARRFPTVTSSTACVGGRLPSVTSSAACVAGLLRSRTWIRACVGGWLMLCSCREGTIIAFVESHP